MPANQVAIQPSIYRKVKANLSAANASETTGATGGVTAYTPVTAANGGFGAKITTLRAQATQTTTLGRIKFWRYDGATYEHLFDWVVTAVTISAGVAGWSSGLLTGANPLTGDVAVDITLNPGDTLVIGTLNAETFTVSGEAQEYGA